MLLAGYALLRVLLKPITMVAAERKAGEEHLYREEKYAAIFQIDMLRCIFCGACEQACLKEAVFLTDRTVASEYMRKGFRYGKDVLLEPLDKDKRIDISQRQTKEVLEFKTHPEYEHNKLYVIKKTSLLLILLHGN